MPCRQALVQTGTGSGRGFTQHSISREPAFIAPGDQLIMWRVASTTVQQLSPDSSSINIGLKKKRGDGEVVTKKVTFNTTGMKPCHLSTSLEVLGIIYWMGVQNTQKQLNDPFL